MNTMTFAEVKNVLGLVANMVIENEKYFCDLDGAAGDGDFGSTLAKGFKGIKKYSVGVIEQDIGKLFRESGMLIMKECGGASGSLWGSAFRSAGKALEGKATISAMDCALALLEFAYGMQKVGGAEIGDKTIIDALLPACNVFMKKVKEGETNLAILFRFATEAAKTGAENTKELIARKGRATYLGERSIGFPDAGAIAVSMMFSTIYAALVN